MSTYVFMKVLESAPERYDRGIRLLSLGTIDRIYGEIARRTAGAGKRILDIGCGTGGVSLACAERGAHVVGIDRNPDMLEIARQKAKVSGLDSRLEWIDLGALEIEDRFADVRFDAIVSCLVFSELMTDEQTYLLRNARERLEPRGTLVVADEVSPACVGGRLWRQVRRMPVVALTYVLTQTTTHAVRDLPARFREAGLSEVTETRFAPGDFAIVQGWRGEDRS